MVSHVWKGIQGTNPIANLPVTSFESADEYTAALLPPEDAAGADQLCIVPRGKNDVHQWALKNSIGKDTFSYAFDSFVFYL